MLQRLGLAPDYYAKVIADVRTAETFLDALRTAQPIVNAAGRWMNQVLDDLNAAIDALAIKIDGVIDEEFREVILYQEALEDEIKPDWELYRASHRERNVAHTKALNRISRARAITLVWLRAHQKMASGIVTPAEWFDINRLPSELFKLGTKSIF